MVHRKRGLSSVSFLSDAMDGQFMDKSPTTCSLYFNISVPCNITTLESRY